MERNFQITLFFYQLELKSVSPTVVFAKTVVSYTGGQSASFNGKEGLRMIHPLRIWVALKEWEAQH